MMKRPTFASLLRETEAFLSALRQMGSEKSPESKTSVVTKFRDVEGSFRFLQKNGTLPT
jgi:hypothetical protein